MPLNWQRIAPTRGISSTRESANPKRRFVLKAHLKFENHTALLALALCFSAGLGKAQNTYEGKFTLPFETHWRGAVLPAGDYTVSIPSESTPYLLYVRGEARRQSLWLMGRIPKCFLTTAS